MKTSSNKDITRDVTEENKEQSSITSTHRPSIDLVFFKTNINSILDSNSSLSMFNISETPVGFSLSHSLYFNVVSLSEFQGYVTNISLRLFTNWEGDNPLYIFALKQISLSSAEIIHRYPVIPQTNNTQWQTIDIPFGEFPISTGYLIGAGMQDRSDTNQIFAVNSVISFYDVDITNNTRDINLKVKFFQGIAFVYTAVKNGKKKSLIKFVFIFFILRKLKSSCNSISFFLYQSMFSYSNKTIARNNAIADEGMIM
jgi:hypothetical protein